MSLDQAQLVERIGGIMREVLSVEAPSPQTDLIEAGLLDSLALVSLIAEIESEFGFQLPLEDVDVDDFRTIERIAGVVSANGTDPAP
jgi:D-alanine--poly(phosphoribitol) ligase subunit 2